MATMGGYRKRIPTLRPILQENKKVEMQLNPQLSINKNAGTPPFIPPTNEDPPFNPPSNKNQLNVHQQSLNQINLQRF